MTSSLSQQLRQPNLAETIFEKLEIFNADLIQFLLKEITNMGCSRNQLSKFSDEFSSKVELQLPPNFDALATIEQNLVLDTLIINFLKTKLADMRVSLGNYETDSNVYPYTYSKPALTQVA